jgi:hypothetical protein
MILKRQLPVMTFIFVMCLLVAGATIAQEFKLSVEKKKVEATPKASKNVGKI